MIRWAETQQRPDLLGFAGSCQTCVRRGCWGCVCVYVCLYVCTHKYSYMYMRGERKSGCKRWRRGKDGDRDRQTEEGRG